MAGQDVASGFVIASRNTTELVEFGKEVLNQVPCLVLSTDRNSALAVANRDHNCGKTTPGVEDQSCSQSALKKR
jgi:hypothetical protein